MVVGNDIYVIGGTIQQFSPSTTIGAPPTQLAITSNEVWRSSDKGLTWDQVAGAARFTPRGSHGSVVLGEDIYVIGGLYGDGGLTPRDDVWRSTDRGVSWSRVTPAGRNVEFPMDHMFASALLGDTMYVMGGIQRTPFTRFNQVWKSTDRGVSWTEATNATDPKFPARSGAAAVVLGSAGAAKLYVIGGSNGPDNFNDVWESSDGTSWTHLNASAATGDTFSGRSEHSAAVLGDAVYVIAGSRGGATRNDIWKSTNTGATWAQVVTSGELFPDRVGLSSVALDGALYVIGGVRTRGSSSPTALFDRVWQSTDGGVSWVSVHKNP